MPCPVASCRARRAPRAFPSCLASRIAICFQSRRSASPNPLIPQASTPGHPCYATLPAVPSNQNHGHSKTNRGQPPQCPAREIRAKIHKEKMTSKPNSCLCLQYASAKTNPFKPNFLGSRGQNLRISKSRSALHLLKSWPQTQDADAGSRRISPLPERDIVGVSREMQPPGLARRGLRENIDSNMAVRAAGTACRAPTIAESRFHTDSAGCGETSAGVEDS